MKKGSIHQDITIVNIHAPNTEYQNIKQMLMDLKGDLHNNTIILYFNIPLSGKNRLPRQKMNN